MTFVFAVAAFGIAIDALVTATGQRLPMRGMLFAGFGLVGLGVLGGLTQSRPRCASNIFDASFGTALQDIVPYAFFHLLPILGALIVLGIGGWRWPRASRGCRPAMVFGLLGCDADLRRRCWPTPSTRSATRSSAAPCSKKASGCSSATASCSPCSAASPTGVRSCGAGRSPDKAVIPLGAARLRRHRPRRAAVPDRRVRQAAGRRRRVRTTAARRSCGTCSPSPATR